MMPSLTRFTGGALFALALIAAGTAGSFAQSVDMREAGPRVVIAANGGDVSAAGATVTVRGPTGDIRAAGAVVDIRAQASGGVSAAGGVVSVDGEIGQDLRIGGSSLTLRGVVGGSARIGGIVIDIDGRIAGDAKIGGAAVTLSRATVVGGDLKAAGGTVTMAGTVDGTTHLAGAVVNFSGRSGGSLTIAADEINISGLAEIGGDLVVYSRNPPIIPDGVVSGTYRHEAPGEWMSSRFWSFKLGLAVAIAAGTVLTGLLMLLFGGRVLAASADTVRHKPISSLLFGLVTFIVISAASLILLATGVGFTVAVALLLILPFLIVFGHATAATGVAGGILVRKAPRLGNLRALLLLIVGSIVIGAVMLIPWFGLWIALVLLLTGLGAFSRTIFSRIRTSPAPILPSASSVEPSKSAPEPTDADRNETLQSAIDGQAPAADEQGQRP